MPSDGLFKTLNLLHAGLVRVSGGRLGWTAAKMPVLKLTTIGRLSGRPRTVMLTSPYQENNGILVVASKGGDDTHPAWFLNLRNNPQVIVTMEDNPNRTMTARVASPEDRKRLWPIVTARYVNYAGYQEKTKREIPLVILEPTV